MEERKDIIRVADVPLVCEECGYDIKTGSLVNEYNDGEETMFYCMGCVQFLVSHDTVWKRED
jgi:hypothetical protein